MYHFHVKVSYINKSAWTTPEWKQKKLVIELPLRKRQRAKYLVKIRFTFIALSKESHLD